MCPLKVWKRFPYSCLRSLVVCKHTILQAISLIKHTWISAGSDMHSASWQTTSGIHLGTSYGKALTKHDNPSTPACFLSSATRNSGVSMILPVSLLRFLLGMLVWRSFVNRSLTISIVSRWEHRTRPPKVTAAICRTCIEKGTNSALDCR